MHYKNGRPAFNGEPVIGKGYDGVFAGTLHSVRPTATSCNGQVAVPVAGGVRNECVTIGDLHHAEDAYRLANEPYEPKASPAPERDDAAPVQQDTAAAPAAAE